MTADYTPYTGPINWAMKYGKYEAINKQAKDERERLKKTNPLEHESTDQKIKPLHENADYTSFNPTTIDSARKYGAITKQEQNEMEQLESTKPLEHANTVEKIKQLAGNTAGAD